ncbi:TetR family transcriptional regulator [Cumulibacter manganitolerans]|uniref:TetR family transcriptional regulator n=1 Tax=Cumulibacter manganitolerans TaxID=1884992 RepID=UPI001297BC96|nr:TetR family transcriptional regulator [Cumulibacter manganitolerans]
MPRPTTPLISRASAVEATLRLIDDEGLESFSLPRLAKELGVRAPSLYHHFADKAELLTEVSRRIVAETPIPDFDPDESLIEWLVVLSCNQRRTMLRHRNAALLVLRYLPRDTLVRLFERSATYLEEAGVPLERQVLILDGLEKLTIGSTAAEALRPPTPRSRLFPNVTAKRYPQLRAAMDANPLGQAELFEQTVRTFLAAAIAPSERSAAADR